MSQNNEDLMLAVLNKDIILESPNAKIKKLRKKKSINKHTLENFNSDQIIYDLHTIKNYIPSQLSNQETNFNLSRLQPEFKKILSKLFVFRSIKEIIQLKNVSFLYDNLRIAGFYNYEQDTHYLEHNERIQINFNLVNEFPQIGSTILIFGSLRFKTYFSNDSQMYVPYIQVQFFRFIPNLEIYTNNYFLCKKFRPSEFDEIVSLNDETCTSIISEDLHQTELNFGETMFLENVELDELLYYEIERLMNINIE